MATPDTSPRPHAGDRRDDIQGVRAIAVLMVVSYHAGLPWPGGFTGPDVFFVVSGFVVTGMLLRERRATGRIAIVSFYLRRARRLAPALAVVSIATLVMAMIVFSPIGTDQQVTALAVAAANTIRANIYFLRQTGGYFQPAAQANPFLHTWTLSVEEQFYLAFPIALVAAWWVARRWQAERSTIALFSVACLASLAASIALSYGYMPKGWTYIGRVIGSYDPLRVAFFFPATRAWEFVAGVVLALAAVQWTPGRALRASAAIAGAILLVLTIVVVRSTEHFPGAIATMPVIATVGLLVGGLGSPAPLVNRLLSIKPLVWLGDRSYSWYLWHWPLVVYARALFVNVWAAPLVAAIVALAPAALSFRFVEEPIHRRRIWPSMRATVAIAVVSVAAPFACAVAFKAAVDRAWGDAQIAAIREAAATSHIDVTAACASQAPLGDPARPDCVWDTPASRGTVLLIGDSHAGHFSEAFIAAAHALHYDAEIATAGGCPFLQRPAYQADWCGHVVEGGLAAMIRREPAYDAIVISNATLGYLDSTLMPFAADVPSGVPVTKASTIDAWVTDLTRTLHTLGRLSSTIVVGDVPQFYQVPQCLRPTLFRGPVPDCGVWTPQWAAAMRTDIIVEERAAVVALGATYLDAGARMCSTEKGCSAFIDGRVAYRDGGHLSVWGGMTFEPDFRAALATVTGRHDAASQMVQ
ncbi:MAG TPA: acyltransferase family protein [Vicinamibacterales bacterium]|nr:acyltransferase family protein [Vicinamibacterales bacterium]